MKSKKLLLLFLFVGIFNIKSWSQITENQVVYDFTKKTISNVNCSENGKFYTYRITNINRFLYDVKVQTKNSEFYSNKPESLGKIFNNETPKESTAKAKAEEISIENETSKINDLKKKIEKLDQELQKAPTDKVLADDKKKAEIELESMSGGLTPEEYDEFIDIMSEIKFYSGALDDAYQILQSIKTIKNKLIGILSRDGLTLDYAQSEVNRLKDAYQSSFDYPEKYLESFNYALRGYTRAIDSYNNSNAVHKKFNNSSEKARKYIYPITNAVESMKLDVNESNFNEISGDIQNLAYYLQSESTFTIVSDPIQGQKDEINFKVSIVPRKDVKSFAVLESRNLEFDVPLSGGIRIDFSTGLFWSMGLHNRTYSSDSIPNDAENRIIKKNKYRGYGEWGLGALLHVSKRTCCNIKPSFAIGVGLNSTELKDANIFLGPSLIFGRQEQFVFSCGLSFAQVDKLKSMFELDTPISKKKLEEGLVEKTTQIGGFFSFTYNLTGKR